tara:strand:- start:3030 stop:3470 length:441 start_codon:yes stop_codon:yes gene_type:complete
MDKLHIRQAVKDDVPRLSELEQTANFGFAPRITDTWHKSLDGQEQTYVAEYDNEIVGYIIHAPVLDKLHIPEEVIHPDYRDKKIGQALINHALSINKEIWAEAEVTNFACQNMLKSCGFYTHSYVKQYYYNGTDAVMMVSEGWQSG